VSAIVAGAMYPLAERRHGQVEIAGLGPDALALVEHQPDGLRLEVVIEPPALQDSASGVTCQGVTSHGRSHEWSGR